MLSKYQCGFIKYYYTLHALLLMIEKYRESVDSGNSFGATLTYHSKVVDCLPHDLKAYGFDETSLIFSTYNVLNVIIHIVPGKISHMVSHKAPF